MMIKGNSALRKNLFTGSKEGSSLYRSHPVPGPWIPGRNMALMRRNQVWMQHRDVRQVAIPLREVEPVADHELVGDLETDETDRHLDLASLRFRQQRADLERCRLARFQAAHQIGER